MLELKSVKIKLCQENMDKLNNYIEGFILGLSKKLIY